MHKTIAYKMKQIYLKTANDHSSSMSSQCRKPAFLVFFVIVMQSITATVSLHSVKQQGNVTDRIALLAIKSRLIDHHDQVLNSWNDSAHHCTWEGITCGRKHNRVTVLDLNSRGLAGTVSPFIGNLSFLRIFWLYNNSLYGEIPKQLGHLFRVRDLRISNNTFAGEIPANISGCVDLEFISLSYNKLEGKLPLGLRALSKIRHFSVHDNYLTGPLFDTLQNFTSLTNVYANTNSFTGFIPNSIGRLRNLTDLTLEENELSGTLPASLFNLSSLLYLDLSDNQLSGELPAHIGTHLPPLKWFNVLVNNLSGSIPITLQNLTTLGLIGLGGNSFAGQFIHDYRNFRSLTVLNIAFNYLDGDINFISSLVNCSQLRTLEVAPNNFSGTLPKSFANLSTSLRWLFIRETPISGTIPPGITNLVNLENLEITNTGLMGAIPHDLGKLHFLESIYLDSNKLSGEVPNSLGNLSHLGQLYLNDNMLEGRLPGSLKNCRSLLYLNLSNNELSGNLGKELFEGSATFVELDLINNHFEGSLSLEISKQFSLEKLRLSKNKFSGMIPDGLGNCVDLQYLYMDGNAFHGDIPSSFASLVSLREIDFSQNNLSGPIPAFFSRFPTLYYLNLSHNNFEGRVPTNSVFENASAVSVAGNNRLCGGIRELHLPRCVDNQVKKRRAMSHALKLIIPIISAFFEVLVTASGLYLAFIRKKNTPSFSGSAMGNEIMKVSYDMLLKATAGFSTENLLGTGSFGSVFKGILNGKTVAVKVLNLQHHGASKSFMAECKALRNIRHRNLVGIITACSSVDFQRNDFKALVYEFMPNGSLDKWLHGVDRNMSLAQRVDVAIDVAHALNYLHHECETPIIHCDLKPSNILLDNDMVAHVGDFGLSKVLTQPQHPNQSSTIGIKGTIGYAAPEYGLGGEASTDGDVYSYGILLLELMTGKSPTNSMFKEDYNLHMYAEAALPDQVLQIVDPSIEENLNEEANDRRSTQDALQRKVECIISVISVGVSCSNHSPHNRMRITDAVTSLQSARDKLVGARRRRNLPA